MDGEFLQFLVALEASEAGSDENDQIDQDDSSSKGKRVRRMRSHPWLAKREEIDGNLNPDWVEMENNDPERFKKTFRMPREVFRHLLSLIREGITKQVNKILHKDIFLSLLVEINALEISN